MRMFEQIRHRIKNIEKVVFVTGAGISQESGIPTFRGKDGYWRNHDPMKLATIDAFYRNPRLVWEWYNERRRNIIQAKANQGHKAIAELEEFVNVVVLTQNIDGLHQKAGSSNVLELHGSIMKTKCTQCEFTDENISKTLQDLPLCKCGNILRPDVVWFGESLSEDVWHKAMIHSSQCDLMVIAGTSLVVSPANTLPVYAKHNEALLVEVNPETTGMTSEMSLSIKATSSIAIPNLVSIFKEKHVD